MNRWVAIAAVAALFLSGISIGALAVILVGHHRAASGMGPGMMMRSPMPPPDVLVDHLDHQLGLTPDQRLKIEAILGESETRSDEIRREIRPRLEAQIEETHRRIVEILTPEQRPKFVELTREMQRHSDRFFLGEHPHGFMHAPPPDGPPSDAPPPRD